MTGKIDRELLIDLVKNEPRLWDQKNKAYHYRDIKSQLWDSIGVQLSIKGDQARKLWENLRDTFRRKCKEHNETKSGQESVRVKWPYFNSMLFLRGIMTFRDHSENLPVPEEEYEPCANDQSPNSDDEDSTSDADRETEPQVHSFHRANSNAGELKTRLKRVNDNNPEEFESKKMKIDRYEQEEDAHVTYFNEYDDDYSFFMSLLPTVKTFNQLEKMRLRMKILKHVKEALEDRKCTT